MKKGFTLLEITIVVALLAVVAAVILVILNPWAQIAKSHDAKRKADLAALQKALEEWYNDKGCYPKPDEICYNDPVKVCQTNLGALNTRSFVSQICNICGNENTPPNQSPSFSPYLSQLPCDPKHPNKKYLYEVESDPAKNKDANPPVTCNDNNADITNPCPSWYRIYSELGSLTGGKLSQDDNYCGINGCGLPLRSLPTPTISPYPFGFGYGISSPNKRPFSYRDTTDPDIYCLNNSQMCNSCGADYNICWDKTQNNGPCSTYKQIYSSKCSCCKTTGTCPLPLGCI
ncbi:MAG: prepilin-type N-terminal cleavage/methylation domain-containing protein [Candidatus Roizmanbacteria bacterium]|nr:MAG: prepilin-type N-terminal cleavage/methylation domain-containing protein [Candidatus Roizmanbacteria bacterium]